MSAHTIRCTDDQQFGNNTFRIGNRFYNIDSYKAPGWRNKLARALARLFRR